MFEIYEKLTDDEDHLAIFDELALDDEKHQRDRLKAASINGHNVGVLLPRGQPLNSGDLLRSEHGHYGHADDDQALAIIQCNDPEIMAKACYQLGRLQVPAEITDEGFCFPRNSLIEKLMMDMQLSIHYQTRKLTPFCMIGKR